MQPVNSSTAQRSPSLFILFVIDLLYSCNIFALAFSLMIYNFLQLSNYIPVKYIIFNWLEIMFFWQLIWILWSVLLPVISVPIIHVSPSSHCYYFNWNVNFLIQTHLTHKAYFSVCFTQIVALTIEIYWCLKFVLQCFTKHLSTIYYLSYSVLSLDVLYLSYSVLAHSYSQTITMVIKYKL